MCKTAWSSKSQTVQHNIHCKYTGFFPLYRVYDRRHTYATLFQCVQLARNARHIILKVMVCQPLRNFPTWTLSTPGRDSSLFMHFQKPSDDVHLKIWKRHTFFILCTCTEQYYIKNVKCQFFVPFQIYRCTEHSWEAYQSNLLQPLYCYNPQYIRVQNRLFCFSIALSSIHNFIWMKGVKHSYILSQHFMVVSELLDTEYISPGKSFLTEEAYLFCCPVL